MGDIREPQFTFGLGQPKPKHLDGQAAGVVWLPWEMQPLSSTPTPLTVDANRVVTAFRCCGVTTSQTPVSYFALFLNLVMRPFQL